MLVTVSMGPANVVNLIAAQFNKYTHISKAEEILQKGESDEEYQFRQKLCDERFAKYSDL